MDIRQLKLEIENNILSDDQMIWKISDKVAWGPYNDESCWFICRQYIDQIAKNKGLTVKFINSFDEVASEGFVEDDNLYIYRVDELKEYRDVKNSIIICNKTTQQCIEIPKLESWQFLDYIKTIVPGVDPQDLEFLLSKYEFHMGRDTYYRYLKFYRDMLKISIFPQSIQQRVLELLDEDGEYSMMSNFTMFDLSNSVVKKDLNLGLEVIKALPYIDSKPDLLFLSIIKQNFKKIIDIQLNPSAKAADLGMSDKQYYAVKKYNCGIYKDKELIEIYRLLTEIENKFKFGGLGADQITDYLICKLFGGI